MKKSIYIFLSLVILFSQASQAQTRHITKHKEPSQKKLNQNDIEIMDCSAMVTQAIMGTCIGETAMLYEDLNNDGDVEFIVTALAGSHIEGTFWYVLEYNETTNSYEQVHVNSYAIELDEDIKAMNVYDRNNDGTKEIFEITEHHLNVYDPLSYELLQSVDLNNTYSYDINAIEFSDVDNDSNVEIIFCDEDETFLYNLNDLTLEREINLTADFLKAGDVDGDGINEIIYSNGDIVQLTSDSYEIEWNFLGESNYEGRIELSDVDEDGILEIAFAKYWHEIKMIDADIQSFKFEINVNSDIDAMSMIDIDNDGIEELIYGDGQWGAIHCLNSQTAVEIWVIDKEDSGTTDVGVADIDKDGELEVFYASGCSSTGSDHLFVHDLNNLELEFKSKHFEGQFHAIEIADLNGDNENEIITMCRDEGDGDHRAVMSVFDGISGALVYQSTEDDFEGVRFSIKTIEVADIDNDQKMDIVIAGATSYSGKIWIINGQDFSLKAEASYGYMDEDIDEFTHMALGDVDQDGVIEIIASAGGYLYQISTEDLNVEWSDESSSYSSIDQVLVEDLDNDGQLEIITCDNYIRIYNGSNHEKWQSSFPNISNLDLIDMDNNGTKEIIGITYEGEIIKTEAYSDDYEVLLETNLDNIYTIKATHLLTEETIELIYSNDGHLYISTLEGKTYRSSRMGNIVGRYNGLKIADKDNNGSKEIFIGTHSRVLEYSKACFECINFNLDLQVSDLSCLPEVDGSIELHTIGGTAPFTFNWSNGSSNQNIFNLEAGEYTVSATDSKACYMEKSASLIQSVLNSESHKTNVDCIGEDNGIIELLVTEGHPPYTYTWNNGNNTSYQENLSIGEYEITISDSKYCTQTHQIAIEQGQVDFELFFEDITCHGYDDASAQVYSIQGAPPFQIEWSNGENNNHHLYNLNAGEYSITITDTLNCSLSKQFTITEPDTIILSSSTTIDDPSTEIYEGTATVYVIGGEQPYRYLWNDYNYQTTQTAYNLPLGEVEVRVSDSRGCRAYHTAHVWTGLEESLNNPLNLIHYPNPVEDYFFIEFEKNQDLNTNEISIYNELGSSISLLPSDLHKISNNRFKISLRNLNSGLYFIHINKSDSQNTLKVFKN